MTYTPKTLADMKLSLAYRYGEDSVPSDSAVNAKRLKFLNDGITYCADQMDMSKDTTLTVVSGTATLPADFKSIESAYSGNIELTNCENEQQATALTYWITGDYPSGYSFNTLSDGTYSISYAFFPEALSADADKCIIPDYEAPVAYAYAMIRKSESDPLEDADKAMSECQNRIVNMNESARNNEGDLTFKLWV